MQKSDWRRHPSGFEGVGGLIDSLVFLHSPTPCSFVELVSQRLIVIVVRIFCFLNHAIFDAFEDGPVSTIHAQSLLFERR